MSDNASKGPDKEGAAGAQKTPETPQADRTKRGGAEILRAWWAGVVRAATAAAAQCRRLAGWLAGLGDAPPPDGEPLVKRLLRRLVHGVRGQYRALRALANEHPKQFLAGSLAIVLLVVFVASITGPAFQGQRQTVAANTIRAEEPDNFAETGLFYLRGVGNMSEDEVREGLTLSPDVPFAVEMEGGDAAIRIETPRKIHYDGKLRTGPAGDANSRVYHFTLGGPALTVRFEHGSSMIESGDAVTLVFSEQVDIYSLREHMSIIPHADFTLDYNVNRVTITPEVGWKAGGSHQVQIDAGYESRSGKQFVQNQVLSFTVRRAPSPYEDIMNEAEENREPFLHFQSQQSLIMNGENDMAMIFVANHLDLKVPVLVDTYRMNSLEKYRDQGNIYLNYDVRLDALEKLDTNAFLVDNGQNRFEIPHFGEGAYILAASYKDPVSGEEQEVRTSYLVTPISVYMQATAMETVVWLNRSDAEAPLAGYSVVFGAGDDDEEPPVTDENGILIVPHTLAGDSYVGQSTLFSVYNPEGEMVYYDNNSLNRGFYYYDRYYSTLFTDRTIYKPEDTVQFWGYAAPYRYNNNEMPETATITFDEGGLNIVVEAEISENGVFYGEVELERIKSSQYAVSAALEFAPAQGEENGTRHVLRTEYVSVREFEKPTFVLDSQIDRTLYGPDDEVVVTVSASFYDGSPLPFYPLEVSYHDLTTYNKVALKGVSTDASGTATFRFPANPGSQEIGQHKGVSAGQYIVQIASDGEQVTHTGGYRYLPSDTLVDYEFARQVDNDNLQLTVRAYGLDSEALAAWVTGGGDAGELTNARLLQIARGEPRDAELNLELRWRYTDAQSIRHSNDQYSRDKAYIEYRTAYSLDYDEVAPSEMEVIRDWENSVKKIKVSTEDGVAVVGDLIYKPEDSAIDYEQPLRLRAAILYRDGKNNECETYAHFQWPQAQNEWDGEFEDIVLDEFVEKPVIPGYSFSVVGAGSDDELAPDEEWYSNITMDAGEQYRYQLLLDSEPVETGGRMLYTVIQNGIYEQAMVGGTSFELPYRLAWGRNVRLIAAYFDGEKTSYVKQLDLYSSDESLKINIEVTPDRDSYRPGDEVNLQVKATDFMGRGVAGDLCVAVVDESIFALSEQPLDTLYDLYRDMTGLDNSVTLYCTTYREEPLRGTGMDGGKDGGFRGLEFYDSYRSDFRDTAVFLPTATDASGNASLRFTLPDNTTSWRITAVEVGRDLLAGEGRSNIISSLPFFVKPVLTSKYIEGDDLALLVQGHGTLLGEDDDIAYTVTLSGDDGSTTLSADGKAYQALEFSFGAHPVGDYTLVARAQYSGYADTVELPVSVLKSNLELVVHKRIDIAPQLDITAARYPVTLTIYDEANEPFMASISSLFGHYCMQANQRLSRFVAKRVIRETVAGGLDIPSYIAEGNDYASDMQNEDGGIGYRPGSASEPLVTTYVLLVAGDQFDHNGIARYYRERLGSLTDKKERAACYLGLAYIGEVEADELLRALDEEEKSGRLDVQAYLVAALAYLGETEQAGLLYGELLHPHLNALRDGKRQDATWERDAAAIWIAASRLQHEDADALSLYFGGPNWRYSTLFECMIYVTNYSQKVVPANYTYTLKGQSETMNLGLTGMQTMVLSRSDLESLRFTDFPEGLTAVAYYVGEPEELGLDTSEAMAIGKTVRALDDNTYEVELAITLTGDAPTGQYDISDWVPSNSRLYSFDKSYVDKANEQTVTFSVTEEGQKLYVEFNNRLRKPQTIRFKYRIRQTYQSQAMLDTTYLIHGDSGENCHSEKAVFRPAPTGEFLPVITEDSPQTQTATEQAAADTAAEAAE